MSKYYDCGNNRSRKSNSKSFHLQLHEQQLYEQQQYEERCKNHKSPDKDTGNPVVHVNVNCCDKNKDENKVRSAFRAIKNLPTQIPTVNTNFKVSFNNEQFDLNNEYNSNTSTFVARSAGVYLFTATLIFDPINENVDYEFGMNLRVNAVSRDVEADYTGFNAAFFNTVDLSEIVMLNEGDIVEVFAFSTTPGTVIAEPRTSFAGAKLS